MGPIFKPIGRKSFDHVNEGRIFLSPSPDEEFTIAELCPEHWFRHIGLTTPSVFEDIAQSTTEKCSCTVRPASHDSLSRHGRGLVFDHQLFLKTAGSSVARRAPLGG